MYRRQRESALETWAVKQARIRGIIVAKLTELDGIPDRIFFLPGGKPLIIEFKAKKKVPEETQQWYIDRLVEYGYFARGVDTKEKFIALMEERCNTGQSKMKK